MYDVVEKLPKRQTEQNTAKLIKCRNKVHDVGIAKRIGSSCNGFLPAGFEPATIG
jgi:hypothetical protein